MMSVVAIEESEDTLEETEELEGVEELELLELLGVSDVLSCEEELGVLEEVSKEVGATVTVKKFVRFETGEGMEKKNEDFAAEVAAQMNA